MDKKLNNIEDLKSKYGKLYFDITSCISEIGDYDVKRFDTGNCFYKTNINVLKQLMDKINDYSSSNKSKKGLLSIFKSPSQPTEILSFIDYNSDKLSQLEHCSKCACFKCIKDCMFDPCAECRPSSHIHHCDKENFNVRVFGEYIVPLINNDTSFEDEYKVLCVVEIEDNNKYIFLQNICDSEERLILEYIPKIRGIEYGEITDEELFDRLVRIYKDSGV